MCATASPFSGVNSIMSSVTETRPLVVNIPLERIRHHDREDCYRLLLPLAREVKDLWEIDIHVSFTLSFTNLLIATPERLRNASNVSSDASRMPFSKGLLK